MTPTLLLPTLALATDSFGQGSGGMEGPQMGVVLFLLGLITGVIAMVMLSAAFVYLKTRKPRFPKETEDLLDELHRPKPATLPGSDTEERERPPWEQDANWWRDQD